MFTKRSVITFKKYEGRSWIHSSLRWWFTASFVKIFAHFSWMNGIKKISVSVRYARIWAVIKVFFSFNFASVHHCNGFEMKQLRCNWSVFCIFLFLSICTVKCYLHTCIHTSCLAHWAKPWAGCKMCQTQLLGFSPEPTPCSASAQPLLPVTSSIQSRFSNKVLPTYKSLCALAP